jgi:hypothetical protein
MPTDRYDEANGRFRNSANSPKDDLKTNSQYKEVKANLPNVSHPSQNAFQLLL